MTPRSAVVASGTAPTDQGARDDLDLLVAGEVVSLLRSGASSSEVRLHTLAPASAWPWLPTVEHGHLAQHPYCENCGSVKYVGSSRPLRKGGIVNLASRLAERLAEEGRKVSEAQFRLIVRRLVALRADDGFLYSRQAQDRLVADAFATYTGLDRDVLASYLRSG